MADINVWHRRVKTYMLSAMLVVASAVLGACHFENSFHFTEDIQLSSGEVITADREVTAKPLGEIGGPGGWEAKYMSFEIKSDGSSGNPPKWESTSGLIPILFDKDASTNEWVLLATFYTCDAWYLLGRPKLPYAEFRVRDGKWIRMELSPQWLGRRGNVLTDIRSSGEPKYMSIGTKNQRMSDPMIAPKYKSIVSKWTTNC